MHLTPYPHDLGAAASAGGGKELLVAVLAVNAVLLLHKADVGQRHVAVVAVELLGVPRAAQRHQEGTPATAKTFTSLAGFDKPAGKSRVVLLEEMQREKVRDGFWQWRKLTDNLSTVNAQLKHVFKNGGHQRRSQKTHRMANVEIGGHVDICCMFVSV